MRTTYYFALGLVIIFSAMAFGGCANQQSANSADTNPAVTSHSSNDLQKTGKRTSGEALQAADPAVTATGGN